MNIEQVKEIFEKGLNVISSPIDYTNLINMRNNLYKLDTINRILLYTQNKEAFDVKTALEWSVLNRDIRKGQTPIYLMVPSYKSQYIDTETGEPVEITDLNIDELNKALKYNIITKVENIESTDIVSYFDIRQTKSINNIEYNINKPIMTASSLLELITNITGCTVEESDIDYYSKKDNKLSVRKQSYNDLLVTLSRVIYQYYIDKLTSTNSVDISDFSEYDNELLNITVLYSIVTLLGGEINFNFDIVRHTPKNRIIDILNISNSIIIEVASKALFSNSEQNIDTFHSIAVTKKAEALLNIMEANDINKKMKGE